LFHVIQNTELNRLTQTRPDAKPDDDRRQKYVSAVNNRQTEIFFAVSDPHSGIGFSFFSVDFSGGNFYLEKPTRYEFQELLKNLTC